MPNPESTLMWSKCSHQPGKSASLCWQVAYARSTIEAITSTPAPGTLAIIQAGGTHPLDGSLTADQPTATADGFNFYEVSVSFALGQPTTPPDPDPLKWPPKFRWRDGVTTEAYVKDAFGNLVRNTAGDIFDPPRQRDIPVTFVTMTRNEPAYDPQRNLKFRGKVCSGPFDCFSTRRGFKVDKGQAKFLSYLPTIDIDERARYVPVAYDWELRADGFYDRVANVGLNGWFSSGGVLKPGRIYGPDNQPIDKPIPLRLDGTPYDPAYTVQRSTPKASPYQLPGNVKSEPTIDGVLMLIYQTFEEEDFGGAFG